MVIYKTINLINKKIYVGKDINNNPIYLGSGTLLKKAIKKYGRNNFKKEILETCNTFEELNNKEIYWINQLNSTNLKIGYNLIDGGSGGIKGWYDSERNKKINERLLIKKYNITDELCKKVINDHLKNEMFLNDLYKKYNLTISTVNYIFKKYNIKKIRYNNSSTFKKQFIVTPKKENEIIRLYVEEEYMQTELQKLFNLSESIIKKIFVKHNIKTRSNREPISERERKYRKKIKTPAHIIAKIIDLRVNKEMVLEDIQKEIGLSYPLIKRVLNENDVSTKRMRWKK